MNCLRKLLATCVFVPLLLTSITSAQVEPGTYLFGIEFEGTVCGYAEMTVSNVEKDSASYILLEHEVLMMRAVLGNEFTSTIELTYHIDPKTGQFTYHDSHIDSGEIEMGSKVFIKEGKAFLSSTFDDEETVVELAEGVILENTLFFPHLMKDFVVGGAEKATYDLLEVREWEVQKTTCPSGVHDESLTEFLETAVNTKSMEVLEHRIGSGPDEDADRAAAEKYKAHVGEYLSPDGSLTVPALVRNGTLCVDIRGQVLPLHDPDEKGMWVCKLKNRLYFVFTRDEAGAVTEMIIHEIVQMSRKSDPEEIDETVPEALVPYLGGYYLPQVRAEFTVLWDDGRLAVHNPLEDRIVHFDPPDEAGRRLDEFGQNTISFEVNDEGGVIAMLLDSRNVFPRK